MNLNFFKLSFFHSPFSLKKKLPFTLLELFLSLIFFSFLALFFSINLKDAREHELFNAEVDQIVSKLNLAQYLMIAADSDTTILFNLKDMPEQILLSLHTEKSLTKSLKKELQKKILTLTSIKKIELDSTTLPPIELKEEDTLPLYFFSNGFIMNEGSLTLYPKNSKNTPKVICLSGYPQLIMSQDKKETTSCNKESGLNEEAISLNTFELIEASKENPVGPK